jgi:glutamate racemase
VQVVVVACNTASSAALELLRAELPIPVVGMEPGVKPAVAATRTRRIGVLATDGTLTGMRFSSLVKRFAGDVVVHTVSCPQLVIQVEAGDLNGSVTRDLLRDYLAPLQEHGVDTIVLGCTHFPFLTPLIGELIGPDVTIIDTGPAVAQQVVRVAAALEVERKGATLRFATTGAPEQVAPVLARLWGSAYPIEQAIC